MIHLSTVKSTVQGIILYLQKYHMQVSLIILPIKLKRIKSNSKKYFRYSNNFKTFNKIYKKLNSNMSKDSCIIFKKGKIN